MPRVRIVVQARSSSSRLAGKALLPIGGIASAVLCALRAARTNGDVVVATSDDVTDDLLASTVNRHGLRVMRGSLENVLERFATACEDLPSDAYVARLTADNVFPDAELIESVSEAAVGLHYLATSGPEADIPYGLRVEVFSVESLREAARHAVSLFDREHVTPWIMREYGAKVFRPRQLPSGFGRLRCTIDTFDDYLRIARVFDGIADPVKEPWLSLCERLAAAPGTPEFVVPSNVCGGETHSKFVLGTAQLGSRYGITNRTGEPTKESAVSIVRTAIEHGVTHLDTARTYGKSETYIGAALKSGWASRVHVVTKLNPIADQATSDLSSTAIVNAVDASVLRSCRELGLATLPTVLLHRAEDRWLRDGVVWRRLKELQSEGLIGRLGLSIEDVQSAAHAFKDPDVKLVQLPLNLLDWRWREAGIDNLAERRKDVIVHARSALLQGLLGTTEESTWSRALGFDAGSIVHELVALSTSFGRQSLADLAIAYVRSQSWVHGIVVGIENRAQLLETMRLFTVPALTREEQSALEGEVPRLPERVLNPALWRLTG